MLLALYSIAPINKEVQLKQTKQKVERKWCSTNLAESNLFWQEDLLKCYCSLGQTKHNLKLRIAEHKAREKKTWIMLKKTVVILTHLNS